MVYTPVYAQEREDLRYRGNSGEAVFWDDGRDFSLDHGYGREAVPGPLPPGTPGAYDMYKSVYEGQTSRNTVAWLDQYGHPTYTQADVANTAVGQAYGQGSPVFPRSQGFDFPVITHAAHTDSPIGIVEVDSFAHVPVEVNSFACVEPPTLEQELEWRHELGWMKALVLKWKLAAIREKRAQFEQPCQPVEIEYESQSPDINTFYHTWSENGSTEVDDREEGDEDPAIHTARGKHDGVREAFARRNPGAGVAVELGKGGDRTSLGVLDDRFNKMENLFESNRVAIACRVAHEERGGVREALARRNPGGRAACGPGQGADSKLAELNARFDNLEKLFLANNARRGPGGVRTPGDESEVPSRIECCGCDEPECVDMVGSGGNEDHDDDEAQDHEGMKPDPEEPTDVVSEGRRSQWEQTLEDVVVEPCGKVTGCDALEVYEMPLRDGGIDLRTADLSAQSRDTPGDYLIKEDEDIFSSLEKFIGLLTRVEMDLDAQGHQPGWKVPHEAEPLEDSADRDGVDERMRSRLRNSLGNPNQDQEDLRSCDDCAEFDDSLNEEPGEPRSHVPVDARSSNEEPGEPRSHVPVDARSSSEEPGAPRAHVVEDRGCSGGEPVETHAHAPDPARSGKTPSAIGAPALDQPGRDDEAGSPEKETYLVTPTKEVKGSTGCERTLRRENAPGNDKAELHLLEKRGPCTWERQNMPDWEDHVPGIDLRAEALCGGHQLVLLDLGDESGRVSGKWPLPEQARIDADLPLKMISQDHKVEERTSPLNLWDGGWRSRVTTCIGGMWDVESKTEKESSDEDLIILKHPRSVRLRRKRGPPKKRRPPEQVTPASEAEEASDDDDTGSTSHEPVPSGEIAVAEQRSDPEFGPMVPFGDDRITPGTKAEMLNGKSTVMANQRSFTSE